MFDSQQTFLEVTRDYRRFENGHDESYQQTMDSTFYKAPDVDSDSEVWRLFRCEHEFQMAQKSFLM